MQCKAQGCQRAATQVSDKCQMHGGSPSHTITIPHRPWPFEVKGHRVHKEEDLEEDGVFFFYCGDCSTGHGLSVGEVFDATPEQRARMTKYALGMFMAGPECDEGGQPEGAQNLNVNISQGATPSAITVQATGEADAATRNAIVQSIREKKRGQINTAANRNRI